MPSKTPKRPDRPLRIRLGERQVGADLKIHQGLYDQLNLSMSCEDEAGALLLRFSRKNRVPDRVRYWYDHTLTSMTQEYFWHNRAPIAIPKGVLVSDVTRPYPWSIVLLLESPHFSEVTFDLTPRYAAAGATGLHLHKRLIALQSLLDRVLPAKVRRLSMPLIICNPIQFPTSCRATDGDMRDDIFERMISDPALSRHFRFRLSRYQPIVLINACTTKLKQLVTSEIEKYAANKGRTIRCHEYKWDENSGAFTGGPVDPLGTDLQLVSVDHPSTWKVKRRAQKDAATTTD